MRTRSPIALLVAAAALAAPGASFAQDEATESAPPPSTTLLLAPDHPDRAAAEDALSPDAGLGLPADVRAHDDVSISVDPGPLTSSEPNSVDGIDDRNNDYDVIAIENVLYPGGE